MPFAKSRSIVDADVTGHKSTDVRFVLVSMQRKGSWLWALHCSMPRSHSVNTNRKFSHRLGCNSNVCL